MRAPSERSFPDTLEPCVFRDVTVDPVRRRVARGETTIELGKLTFELLLLLVDAAPRVVTYDEIADTLWRGRPVTPETVRQRVKLLRRALSDNPANPRYIRLVRGHGYQLIPDVVPIEPNRPSRLARPSLATAGGLLSLLVILATVAAFVVGRPTPDTPMDSTDGRTIAEVPVNENFIAVLPFERLSPDTTDANFVDGVHNDVITQLSKIESLRVISRSSVMEYRQTSKSASQIGRELGVTTVLEGSVQGVGDQVRISVQLTDTESGAHLWAELYDRELTAENVFAIQSEMAAAVASALRATLTPDEVERLEHVPTRNSKAYSHYLLGVSQLRQADNTIDYSKAAEAFEAAVDEDPGFALAWAALGHAYSSMYFFVDKTEARRELARIAIDRASAIDPDLPDTHLARGYYYDQAVGDYARALEEWAIAERGMPGDSRIHMARAYLHRHIDDFEEAARNLDLASALDPRNVETLFVQFSTLSNLHRYDEALRYADRIIAIRPDRPLGYRLRSITPIWNSGDGVAAIAALDSGPREFGLPHQRWNAYLFQRDYDAALNALETFNVETRDVRGYYRPKDWYYGVTYEFLGEADLAARHYEAAREEAERELERRPRDARVLVGQADIVARQGAHDEAVGLALRALEAMSESVPMPQRYWTHLNIIRALVAAQDYDRAIVELEQFLEDINPWSLRGLLRDPRLEAIRDDERVVALRGQYD